MNGTLERAVQRPFDSEVGDLDDFESVRAVFGVEVFEHPVRFLEVAYNTTNAISKSQDLVNNMTPNHTIRASHADK